MSTLLKHALTAVGLLVLAASTARPGTAPSPAPHPTPVDWVETARAQIGLTVTYDPAYVPLAYPGGDVPRDRGVCTDVVIRALRDCGGPDLQARVHDDMRARFDDYPKIWGLRKPDKNIDHRRVPNLQTWFRRQGAALPITADKDNYQPGDIITCLIPGNLPHIMIVSDRRSATGVPLVIHNIGRGTQEEDGLFSFKITGHYRLSSKSTP